MEVILICAEVELDRKARVERTNALGWLANARWPSKSKEHMTLSGDVDQHWLLFGAVLVIYMHAGFTLLEVGSVQRKNTKNILSNLMLPCLSAILWWLVGYEIVFGDDDGKGFIGTTGFGATRVGFAEACQVQQFH